jgi:hypothetical protein
MDKAVKYTTNKPPARQWVLSARLPSARIRNAITNPPTNMAIPRVKAGPLCVPFQFLTMLFGVAAALQQPNSRIRLLFFVLFVITASVALFLCVSTGFSHLISSTVDFTLPLRRFCQVAIGAYRNPSLSSFVGFLELPKAARVTSVMLNQQLREAIRGQKALSQVQAEFKEALWIVGGVAIQLFFLLPFLVYVYSRLQPYPICNWIQYPYAEICPQRPSFSLNDLVPFLIPFTALYLVAPIPFCIFATWRQRPKKIVSPVQVAIWTVMITGIIIEAMLPTANLSQNVTAEVWVVYLVIFAVAWVVALASWFSWRTGNFLS